MYGIPSKHSKCSYVKMRTWKILVKKTKQFSILLIWEKNSSKLCNLKILGREKYEECMTDFRIQTGTLKYPNPLYHVKNQTIIMILSTNFAILTKS